MGVPRDNPITSLILEVLDLDIPLIPLESPYQWLARRKRHSRKQYRESIRRLKNTGVIDIIKKSNVDFIKITEKGALKVLLAKARVCKTNKWDGKWRVLVFDIPEDFHSYRDRFRKLLKQNNFIKLQASVFVSPYPLSRDAIRYLEESGLRNYIRIMKVEEMDNDKDLKQKFGLLNKSK
jgi:CRISPR-associated endonuclease Cas2